MSVPENRTLGEARRGSSRRLCGVLWTRSKREMFGSPFLRKDRHDVVCRRRQTRSHLLQSQPGRQRGLESVRMKGHPQDCGSTTRSAGEAPCMPQRGMLRVNPLSDPCKFGKPSQRGQQGHQRMTTSFSPTRFGNLPQISEQTPSASIGSLNQLNFRVAS